MLVVFTSPFALTDSQARINLNEGTQVPYSSEKPALLCFQDLNGKVLLLKQKGKRVINLLKRLKKRRRQAKQAGDDTSRRRLTRRIKKIKDMILDCKDFFDEQAGNEGGGSSGDDDDDSSPPPGDDDDDDDNGSAIECGNAILESGEECDDGNLINEDGCSDQCIIEYCGDGIIQAGLGESCDLNQQLCTTGKGYPGSQTCNSNCDGFEPCQTSLYCGDGICTAPAENINNCFEDCSNLSAVPGPVAVWAYPDGVSVSGTVSIGVAAYHRTGMKEIEFRLNGKVDQIVKSETINLDTQESEWIYVLDTTVLQDATHFIDAIAHPLSGPTHKLPTLEIQVNNSRVPTTWHVDQVNGNDDSGEGSSGNPFQTLFRALNAARGGDRVELHDGAYQLRIDTDFGFTEFVTIAPAQGASPRFTSRNGVVRANFLHFEDLAFDWSNHPTPNYSDIIFTTSSHHLRFTNCDFQGPANSFSNYMRTIVVANSAKHLTVEDSSFRNVNRAIVSTGRLIARGNDIGPIYSDAFNFVGNNILISNNDIHDIRTPQMYIQSEGSIPFDLSTNKDLTIYYEEFDDGNYVAYSFPDLSVAASNPSQVSPLEIVAALRRNAQFSAKLTASVSGNSVRISAKRTNYLQCMYVVGNANLELLFPENGQANETCGSGQHADVFQTWDQPQRNIIIRDNKAFDNSCQGFLSEASLSNFAMVNNLWDHNTFQPGPWTLTWGDELFSNVLFMHNTIIDTPNGQIFTSGFRASNFYHLNNFFMGNTPQGDLNIPGMTMDYNFYNDCGGVRPSPNPNSTTACYTAAELFDQAAGVCSGETCDLQGEFTISETSPLRDFGTLAPLITYDVDRARRLDGMPDAGAYEYRE